MIIRHFKLTVLINTFPIQQFLFYLHGLEVSIGIIIISNLTFPSLSFLEKWFRQFQGPIENKRTLNLIQWAIQLFSLLLIFLSSYHQIASLSIALAIVGWASIPDSLKTRVQVSICRGLPLRMSLRVTRNKWRFRLCICCLQEI